MGRTDGKLIHFLRNGLSGNLYANLEIVDSISFSIDLKRYHKNLDMKYQKIIHDYFVVTNKEFISYSNGKAVLKAALKKSVYLVMTSKIGTKQFYRFATEAEIIEKKKAQKEKRVQSQCDSPSSPVSSGYESAAEDFDPGSPLLAVERKLENSSIQAISLEAMEEHSENELPPAPDFDHLLELDDEPFDEGLLMEFNFQNNLMHSGVDATDDQAQVPSSLLDHYEEPDETSLAESAIVKYVNDGTVPVSAFPACQDSRSISSATVMAEKTSVDLEKDLELQNEALGENGDFINISTSIPADAQNIARKKIWQCKEKMVVNNYVMYVCESDIVEFLVEEEASTPEVVIPLELFEKGKIHKGQFILGELLLLFFA